MGLSKTSLDDTALLLVGLTRSIRLRGGMPSPQRMEHGTLGNEIDDESLLVLTRHGSEEST